MSNSLLLARAFAGDILPGYISFQAIPSLGCVHDTQNIDTTRWASHNVKYLIFIAQNKIYVAPGMYRRKPQQQNLAQEPNHESGKEKQVKPPRTKSYETLRLRLPIVLVCM